MGERDIKSQKLLYHLTAIKNLPSIFAQGLLPRSSVKKFQDVADAEIINKRHQLGLDHYVPFHWFARNPFDGVVQQANPGEQFALIAVHRDLARAENWKVLTRHPLATESTELLDYSSGFEAIDWAVMNQRDYRDANCKSICMAECLSPNPVPTSKFYTLFVPNDDLMSSVVEMGCGTQVVVNPLMFNR